MRDEITKEAISQFLALITFFAFPAFQYFSLKWFARKEGEPELWYLPRYNSFRLVIRNIPGRKTLSEIKTRALVRNIVSGGKGGDVATYMDEILIQDEGFFLFPGNDQVIVSFRIEGADESHLNFVYTDKLGTERKKVPLANIHVLVADYSATLENFLNFDVKLAKRAELKAASMIRIWKEIQEHNEEARFDFDRIRSVG